MGPLGASSTCFGMRRQHVIYTCLTIALVWLAVQWAWETDKDGSAASSSDSTFVFQFKVRAREVCRVPLWTPAGQGQSARGEASRVCVLTGSDLYLKAAKHALSIYAYPAHAVATRAHASLTPLLPVALVCPQFFLAGSICACLSHVGGVPIDVLKTRLQTDPGRYDGLWDAAVKVTRTEGPGMLLQGLGPTATGYAVQGAAPGAKGTEIAVGHALPCLARRREVNVSTGS